MNEHSTPQDDSQTDTSAAAREKTKRNTMIAGAGIFAVVFTFLGYQLGSGKDPALSGEREGGAWQAPSQQQDQQQGQQQFQQPGSDWGDDDSSQSGQQSQSGPPTSRAS